tara:strand:- start:955 stop:1092 length:138 start_codon:yes stop_codon:yes gene_type:complete
MHLALLKASVLVAFYLRAKHAQLRVGRAGATKTTKTFDAFIKTKV